MIKSKAKSTNCSMATKEVIFRYMFPAKLEFIQYTHSFPVHLCVRPQDQPNAELRNAAFDEVSRLNELHLDECRELSAKSCEECGATATELLPTSLLTTIDGPQPFVGVMVSPICEKEQCARKTDRAVRATMDSFGYMGQGHHDPKREWKLRCGYCREWGNVKACQGCRKVSYGGKNCQKAAWKMHKPLCGHGLVVEPVD